MLVNSDISERNAVITVAELMAAAARTAPKTRGIDHLETLILTGEDITRLADKMKEYGETADNAAFFVRDSKCVAKCSAVLLIATKHYTRGLNELCGLCGAKNCADCVKTEKQCVYDPIDLGIALGSAAGIAAANHIDSRIMFSAGQAAKMLRLFTDEPDMVFALPLAVTGKSVFFDRG